jgi:hypothetical protein
MPDDAQQIELESAWIGADDLPVQFANAFTGVVGPNAAFVTIGSQVPPAVESEEDLNQLRTFGYIPVKPIVRIALTPQGLDDLIEALKTTQKNHRVLLKALGGEEQS